MLRFFWCISNKSVLAPVTRLYNVRLKADEHQKVPVWMHPNLCFGSYVLTITPDNTTSYRQLTHTNCKDSAVALCTADFS